MEQMTMMHKMVIGMILLLASTTTGGCQRVGGGNIILTGYRMESGTALTKGNYTFVMQGDCNLVLYGPQGATWNSQTAGRGTACYVILQGDGNLVVYDQAHDAKWASGKLADSRKGGFYLNLRETGNVQILYGTEEPQEVLWSIP